RHISFHEGGERPLQRLAHALLQAERLVLDLQDREQIAGSRGDKDFVRGFEIAREQRFLSQLDPRYMDLTQQYLASDPGQASRAQGRRPHAVSLGNEDVRRGAFGDLTPLVEKEDFVEPAALR